MQFPPYTELEHDGSPALIRDRACSLLFVHVTNPNDVDVYLRLHDTDDVGELGSALHTFHIPPSFSVPFTFGHWMRFNRGLTYTITTQPDGTGLPSDGITVNARTE